MNVSLKKDSPDIPSPCNAHASDTGYDLVAASEPVIIGEQEGSLWKRIDYVEYDCGLQVAPPVAGMSYVKDGHVFTTPGYLLVYPRSSISKTNLVLANSVAVIDNSFRGTIKLRFRYLLQPIDMRLVHDGDHFLPFIYQVVDDKRIYRKGDKIGQAVAAWKESIDWEIVESLDETVRQSGGFGSTDQPKTGTGWKS